jgi:hypothetical protein
MRRPARTIEVSGTMNGPTAIAVPAFSPDQSQPSCSHSAIDSSSAPKAAEKGTRISAAAVEDNAA